MLGDGILLRFLDHGWLYGIKQVSIPAECERCLISIHVALKLRAWFLKSKTWALTCWRHMSQLQQAFVSLPQQHLHCAPHFFACEFLRSYFTLLKFTLKNWATVRQSLFLHRAMSNSSCHRWQCSVIFNFSISSSLKACIEMYLPHLDMFIPTQN